MSIYKELSYSKNDIDKVKDINNPDIQAIKNKKISRQKKFDLIYKACSNVNRCGSKTTDGCWCQETR
eukprot:gene12121-15227_t